MEKEVYSLGGPCGAGKDTIAKAIVDRFPGKIIRFPRITTRAPRVGEHNGVEYDFVSEDLFGEKKELGKIVATDSAGVAWYGIHLENLNHMILNGSPSKILIVGGICGIRLKEFIPGVKNIYITADIGELIQRLLYRGHRGDDFHKRLHWIHAQLAQEPKLFDAVIENHQDRLEETVCAVEKIMNFSPVAHV